MTEPRNTAVAEDQLLSAEGIEHVAGNGGGLATGVGEDQPSSTQGEQNGSNIRIKTGPTEQEGEFISLEEKLQEEIDQEEAERQGAVKSFASVGNGAVVYYRGKNSDFTILVKSQLIIHGYDDEKEAQPMTLILMEYHLHCKQPRARFQHVTTSIDFGDRGDTKPSEKSNPEVISWAPFYNRNRSDEVEAEHRVNRTIEGEAGGEGMGGKVALKISTENEIIWKRKYFSNCQSCPRQDTQDLATGRQNGVEWSLEHNELQKGGVPNKFSLAILLKRSSPTPFMVSRFSVRTRAGLLQDIQTKLFSWNSDRTKPILFVPGPEPRALTEEGKAILAQLTAKGITPNNLGKLSRPGELVKLTSVWGIKPVD